MAHKEKAMPKKIKKGLLVYHLTALGNLPSILEHGLKSRSTLPSANFEDIADQEIITSRRTNGLEELVPFHFFSKTPFDYAAQHNHREQPFVFITVKRNYASENNWRIIPSHPLSGQAPNIMDYKSGFDAINWDLMESDQHRYDTNPEYKQTCMAECLSESTVDAKNFHSILVRREDDAIRVRAMLNNFGLKMHLNIQPHMFVG
ncbi:MAG TPA: DUF4433 domain-containing protein [Gammaproteobacteria bacterium]|nr:DUF4433 domain-containing protein [Gammaproteobacteria bacterium]|tara:strand:+ start:249 stop:860 length:612 start_codon:yes stop_codon:yes gene_type:complete